MFRTVLRVLFIALLLMLIAMTASAMASAPQTLTGSEVPITTRSAEARKLFLQGRESRENWHLPEALDAWRAAAKKDPKFALAHVYVSFYTPNPTEELAARTSAKLLAPQCEFRGATPGALVHRS